MNKYLGLNVFENPEKYDEVSKEVDEAYIEAYNEIKKRCNDDGTEFSDVAVIRTLSKVKASQLACLIGQNLTEHDMNVLMGLIERHVAGVLYKG